MMYEIHHCIESYLNHKFIYLVIFSSCPSYIQKVESSQNKELNFPLLNTLQILLKEKILAGLSSPSPKESYNLLTIVPSVAKKLELRSSLPCRM